MKIVLASPLYPPDIEEPAPYVKELAGRLASAHEITVVTYGRLPEQVPGVRIITVDKRQPLPLRLAAYTLELWRAARAADLVYAENGPSVELPIALAMLFARRRLVLQRGDKAAHVYAQKRFLRRMLERLAAWHAEKVIIDVPLPRPEILPFSPPPERERAAWERDWQAHTAALEKLFTHAT